MDYPFSIAAIDVGGTKIAGALVNYEGCDQAPTIALKHSIATEAPLGGQAVLNKILDFAAELLSLANAEGLRVAGIGVAAAGRVDVHTGNIAYANEIMPGWSGQPLGDALRARFVIPVAVLGDVQAHALGEARWGAAKGVQTALVAAPGTGLGGGFICHGRVLRGAHGFAGEIGATLNTLNAQDGNLESVCAGSGMEARYYAATGLRQTGAEISHRAQLGDQAARDVIEDAGRALGIALANWANIFDPEMVVISGSVTKAGVLWRSALDAGFKAYAPAILAELPIVEATLGDGAPLVGAAENLLDVLR